MTYGNGILPYAFLRYGQLIGDKKASNFGYKLLKFIQARCEDNRKRGPIGNDGWLTKGSHQVPTYSQQPIDAAYMIWAWVAAFEYGGKKSDLEKAKSWMQWYEGDNVANEKMYDAASLAAYDGIDKDGVHYNSGAESNICLLLSKHMLDSTQSL